MVHLSPLSVLLVLVSALVLVNGQDAQIVVMIRDTFSGNPITNCDSSFPYQTAGFYGLTSGQCFNDQSQQGWTGVGYFSATDAGSSASIAFNCGSGCGSTCLNVTTVTYGTCAAFANSHYIQVWKVVSAPVTLVTYTTGCGQGAQTLSLTSGRCTADGTSGYNFVAQTQQTGTYAYALDCSPGCNACITYNITTSGVCVGNAGAFASIGGSSPSPPSPSTASVHSLTASVFMTIFAWLLFL